MTEYKQGDSEGIESYWQENAPAAFKLSGWDIRKSDNDGVQRLMHWWSWNISNYGARAAWIRTVAPAKRKGKHTVA